MDQERVLPAPTRASATTDRHSHKPAQPGAKDRDTTTRHRHPDRRAFSAPTLSKPPPCESPRPLTQGTKPPVAGDATVQRFAPAALAATEYRERFGWSVVHRDGDLMLSLGNGVVGVAVPATHAHHVLAALQRQGLRGPVIGLQAVSFAWVFLAERNGMVVAQEDLPPRVKVLDCPSQVPLPSAHAASRRAAWIVAPDIRHRWLPILATVIAAARDAIRA